VTLLARHGDSARVVAGGTDLLVEYSKGRCRAPILVDVTRIPQLNRLDLTDGRLVIGAAVTHARLATSELLSRAAPLLSQAAWQIGSPQVRNRGTIGGSLGTASPSGDCLPPLAALDAEVEIAGPDGRRLLPLAQFMLGPKRTALREGDLIVAVRCLPLPPGAGSAYLKFGLRQGRSIAVASAAVIVGLSDGRVDLARIALGAVSPRIGRAEAAERSLLGQPAGVLAWAAAAQLAAESAVPISDVRGTAGYRRHLARVLVERRPGAGRGGGRAGRARRGASLHPRRGAGRASIAAGPAPPRRRDLCRERPLRPLARRREPVPAARAA